MDLQSILGPVYTDLELVEQKLTKFSESSDLPLLDELIQHVFNTKGKRARPALTLLTAGFYEDNKDSVITMATAVEMLHVATLIHDDTVDEAKTRRGQVTISSGWNQHTAVMVGDYVFAASATFVCSTGNIYVIKRFSETIMELSRGQLQETSYSYNPNVTEKEYLDRIYYKTASLFSTSGESGAVLSGAPESVVSNLKRYSLNIGLAFQIIDDILDYEGNELSIGKPVGNDLRNGILTLPTIYAMDDPKIRSEVTSFFKSKKESNNYDSLTNIVKNSNGIERSFSYAHKLVKQAQESLIKLPRNTYRASLEELSEFMISRLK